MQRWCGISLAPGKYTWSSTRRHCSGIAGAGVKTLVPPAVSTSGGDRTSALAHNLLPFSPRCSHKRPPVRACLPSQPTLRGISSAVPVSSYGARPSVRSRAMPFCGSAAALAWNASNRILTITSLTVVRGKVGIDLGGRNSPRWVPQEAAASISVPCTRRLFKLVPASVPDGEWLWNPWPHPQMMQRRTRNFRIRPGGCRLPWS